jgi:RNA polymerase sigma-70 factor (ECF subfamily)
MLRAKKRLTAENAHAADPPQADKFNRFSAISAGSAVNSDDAKDRREKIRQAVWSLRRPERELIVMRYFDGFSQSRISEVLGISPQAVNGRLVRAKRKIAKYLKRSGLTGGDHEKS